MRIIRSAYTAQAIALTCIHTIILILMLVVCAWQKHPKLTIHSLANATYTQHTSEQSDARITLISGHYEAVDTLEDGTTIGYAMDLDTVHIVFADLRGDDRDYAALFLSEWGGGTGIFTSLNVVVDSNGVPFQLADFVLGDHVEIDSVFVRDRVIHVTGLVRRYSQEIEPPDSLVAWSFRLDNNVLKEVSSRIH